MIRETRSETKRTNLERVREVPFAAGPGSWEKSLHAATFVADSSSRLDMSLNVHALQKVLLHRQGKSMAA